MKKQVLSFSDFVNEHYTILEDLKGNKDKNPVSSDWSDGGKITWENAKISSILSYIEERDKGKDYTKIETYEPVFKWFKDNQEKIDARVIKDSLLVWVGDDPYYGLEDSRKKALESNHQYADQNVEKNITLIDYSEEWDKIIKTINPKSDNDKDVIRSLKTVSSLLRSMGNDGFSVKLNSSWYPNNFVNGKMKETTGKKRSLPYLKDGGYTEEQANYIDEQVKLLRKRLKIDTKGSYVKSEDNLDLIKADDNDRRGILEQIEEQVKERIGDPILDDGIFSKNKEIKSIIDKATLITFDKSSISNEIEVGEISSSNKIQYIKFLWPDESIPEEERDNFSYNFFGKDDLTNLSTDSSIAIDNISKGVANFINNSKSKYPDTYQIVSIKINSFSSTSTVNSSFGTNPPKYNRDNNVKLVEERNKSIYNYTEKSIKNILTEDYKDSAGNKATDKIQKGSQLNYPNSGPNWESVGGESYGQKYDINDYGPLFQAEYAKNKSLTPKEFYSLERRKDPKIKEDYELTYSGYRKAWVWVTLEIKGLEEPLSSNIESDAFSFGNFEAYILWAYKGKSRPAKPSKKTRYTKAKDNMPLFTGRKIECTL